MIRAFDRQTKCRHILERLMKEAVKLFVACLDFHYCLQPLRHRFEMRRLVTGFNTVIQRMEELITILELIEQSRLPGLVRLKCALKSEPAISRNSVARSTRNRNCYRAAKI